MGAGHDHSHGTRNERALKIALGLTTTFLIAEFVGGILTKSLALISDAAHMFTDAAALAIALAAIQIGKRAADKRRTFGYYRFEILAAAFNALMLFGVAIYILYEAYQRLRTPAEVQSLGMLVIAVIGLIVNVLSMRLLSAGQDQSLNVKGAYLEVWSDLLGSVGVIFAAIIIRFTGWQWVDSAIAVLIGLWVLPRTWLLLKLSINILLEGVPEDIDLPSVEEALLSIPGVRSLHDLHVWALTSGKVSLTAHLVNDPNVNAEAEILPEVRSRLAQRFSITHITVQFELTPCEQADATTHFLPSEPADTSAANKPDSAGSNHQGHSH
ncbi:cation diffusion facilitator family transporter [Ralstonia pickettii]|uniref:Cation diffusion facilitator family transporter n=1 Tax=Ralstonia pickettii TaxID=329 RepID=A0A7X2HKA5_RALPI|nr:cation diffusion facilitator family transporter [Ralstonia pickettii]MRS98079.1 cation diffusion facilitator family transporter [Ralstonia pickettii]